MFTVIDDGVPHDVDASIVEGRVVLTHDALASIGWEVHPEGLCRDGVCIPVPEGAGIETGDGGIDLQALARVLDRPLALDLEESVGYLGVSAGERQRLLRSLVAPDFTLPDLSGRPHRLSDHRGKKILLVAYASW
jgi:hypothetical protein